MQWRTMTCVGILFVVAVSAILSIEEFPFSNYPMYSDARLNNKRLTLLLGSDFSALRPIRNDELAPMKRIHLGYLLKEARNGVPAAQKSVAKILEHFSGKAHIALVSIEPGLSASVPYSIASFEILPQKNFVESPSTDSESAP